MGNSLNRGAMMSHSTHPAAAMVVAFACIPASEAAMGITRRPVAWVKGSKKFLFSTAPNTPPVVRTTSASSSADAFACAHAAGSSAAVTAAKRPLRVVLVAILLDAFKGRLWLS